MRPRSAGSTRSPFAISGIATASFIRRIAAQSAVAAAEHYLGHLLIQIVFAMHNLQAQQVTIKGNRRFQIDDRDTDMIKTEQPGQHTPEIGGHWGHGH